MIGSGERGEGIDTSLNSYIQKRSRALFSSKIFCKIGIVPLSFVFDKYYIIMY